METMYDYEQETFTLPEKIVSEEQAEEILRQYKTKLTEITRAEISAKKYLEAAEKKVMAYTAQHIEPEKQSLAYLESLLTDWAKGQIAQTGKRSVKLIDGTISFTKAQTKYDRHDEETIEYIKKLPEDHPLRNFLKEQDPKLDWAELKKYVKVEKDNVYFEGAKIPGIIAETNLPDIVKIK